MNIIDKVKQKLHKETIESVEYLDIYRFMGQWYEIARIGKYYDEKLTNVTLTYSLNEKGRVRVLLAGNKDSVNGPFKQYEGKATVQDQCNSKFEIEFLWPFKSDYIIMDIDRDYQWCLIGTSNRKHSWILSRQQFISEELRRQLMKKLDTNGFDIHKLEFVLHAGQTQYDLNQEELKFIQSQPYTTQQQPTSTTTTNVISPPPPNVVTTENIDKKTYV